MMATLGARILAPEKRVAETAQTAAIHRAGENSVLASIAQSISIGLTHCLEWMALWVNVSGEIKVTLNTDYLPNSMTSEDVKALVTSWQAGAISHETLFSNLVKGEIIASDVQFADEKERIDLNAPGLPSA
jgi:hypothetical protein